MPVTLVLLIYNLFLPLFVLVAFPAWVLKMWKRGGYGTGLMQRLAVYDVAPEDEQKGGVYIHAVSVGEVMIALKLIDKWLELYPTQKIVLAATTATGHEVARRRVSKQLRVIYSPLDFGFIVRSVFGRFQPQQIILVESEIWPNMMRYAQKKGIPVSVVNARLSKRSEARYHQFGALVKPVFAMVDQVCAQNEDDVKRFVRIGFSNDKVHCTGSIKFDSDGGAQPVKRLEFQEILNGFGEGRQVVLAVSTHIGEERLVGSAFLQSGLESDCLLVIAPRHAERRSEVVSDLSDLGFSPVLKTEFDPEEIPDRACLIVDTTGELRDWTAHASITVIGKSFLGRGGQNPVESIMAGVPVISGEHMGNFEPLVSQLREKQAIVSAASEEELAEALKDIHADVGKRAIMTESAQRVVSSHSGAVGRTVKFLYLKAESNHARVKENTDYE